MKKSLLALAAVFLVATSAQAQFSYGVKVVNATGHPIIAQVGRTSSLIGANESGMISVRLYIFRSQNIELTAEAAICGSVAWVPFAPVPAWAQDFSFVGQLAITEDYLKASPGEKDLKSRVKALKKLLDGRDYVGRGQMKHELQDWFKTVRKLGFNAVMPRCETIGRTQGLRLWIDQNNIYYYEKRMTLFVRGNQEEGYSISEY